jgi:hypothetical protein
MRKSTSLPVLVGAALVAAGCQTAQKLAPAALDQPSTVFLVTGQDSEGNWVCSVKPKTVIIDYPSADKYADQVTWLRFGETAGEVKFFLKTQADRDMFPDIERHPMPTHHVQKKSGKPQTPPTAGQKVEYTIQWRGAECDPEICIRKEGGGCSNIFM